LTNRAAKVHLTACAGLPIAATGLLNDQVVILSKMAGAIWNGGLVPDTLLCSELAGEDSDGSGKRAL
jgi:hypothetical protein